MHSNSFSACLSSLRPAGTARLQLQFPLPLDQAEPAQLKTFSQSAQLLPGAVLPPAEEEFGLKEQSGSDGLDLPELAVSGEHLLLLLADHLAEYLRPAIFVTRYFLQFLTLLLVLVGPADIVSTDDFPGPGMNDGAFLRFLEIDEDVLHCILANHALPLCLLLLFEGLLPLSNSPQIQLPSH